MAARADPTIYGHSQFNLLDAMPEPSFQRMPTHFGSSTGPRIGPDGKPFDWRDNRQRNSTNVSTT